MQSTRFVVILVETMTSANKNVYEFPLPRFVVISVVKPVGTVKST